MVTTRSPETPLPAVAVRVDSLKRTVPTADGPVSILDVGNLDIQEGVMTAIIGASGAGKSTLLKVMGGLDVAQEGSVWIGGVNVAAEARNEHHRNSSPLARAADVIRLSKGRLGLNTDDCSVDFDRWRAQRIGYIDQHATLLDGPGMTVTDNLRLPSQLAGIRHDARQSHKLAERLGITEFSHVAPHNLSGGQRSRIGIFRALSAVSHRGGLILADEPTADLDSESKHHTANLLGEACRKLGATTIIVTHDENLLEYADNVVTMADGRVIDQSAPGIR